MEKVYKNIEFYKKNLNPAYSINHKLSDRTFWDSCRGEFYDKLCKQYQEEYGEISALRISDYLLFFSEGSRIAYENPYFMRRSALMWYCYMEAIENEGRYFNKLIDVLWAILEETQWCIPAHSNYTQARDCIPHEGDSGLDLFAGKTAMEVSTVYAIFQEKIDAVSMEFRGRISRKLQKEVYHNMLNNDYSWMGYGRIPNNWNPWIVSNTVKSIINMGQYEELEYKVLSRCAQVFEMYYDNFPEDGGCDEGALYWNQAGGNVVEYLNDMYGLTNGKFDLILENKTKQIAEFLYHTYISAKHCLGFSDAVISTKGDYGFLYHVGKSTASDKLINLAKRYYDDEKTCGETEFEAISNRYLYRAEAIKALENQDTTLNLPLEHYYESIKLWTAREKSAEPFGLFLSVKANHNAESHNHLDTGNYIVYKNQVPFIVDAGSKVYTAKTFSSERYKIWNTKSEFHNLPIINGTGQQPGKKYEAVEVSVKDNIMHAKLDKAYGRDFIKSYIREVQIIREQGIVVVRDSLELNEEKEVVFVFMTPAEVEISDSVKLTYQNEVLVIVPNHSFDITVEKIEDDDARIVASWGTNLKRVLMKTVVKKGDFEFMMR